MAEYIKRETLIDDLTAAMDHRGIGQVIGQTLIRYVKRQPAADVAPVVRCQDCECWHTTECALDYAMFEPTEFSFCSYGKRKDGADHE